VGFPNFDWFAKTDQGRPLKRSAGLLMFRRRGARLEVFLVHPGGPFWAKKDSWTIPKGEYDSSEAPLDAALREFQEETSFQPHGPFIALGETRQPSGKIVTAWAFEGDCDPAALHSNTCMVEWPPRSGKQMKIPEVDRGAWFRIEEARPKIFKGQDKFLDRLVKALLEDRAHGKGSLSREE
jgi:predicted NUDIX family NTP pyrophosphohydrolase